MQMSQDPLSKTDINFDVSFVQLYKVNNASEVHEVQRYLYSPFQLLGIENEIGEDKMMAFIKSVYPALSAHADGYSVIINTLKNIGVDNKTIKRIEKKYFKQLSLMEYSFIESVLFQSTQNSKNR
jgi:flagellar biosynthesis regulator FlbT